MTYSTDIDALLPDHRWALDGNSADSVGSTDGTDTSMLYTSSGICEDATNCAETNAISDRISIPTTTDINNSAQSRKTVGGWFVATGIQNPPKNVYGEGDATQAFRFILGWGNNIMFEVHDPSFTLQIFGDVALEVNRPYHFLMAFEGNGYSNEFKAYLDGVEQLNAEPTDRQPDAATLTARGVAEFGDPAGTVGVGGTAVVLIAPINGKWNHWATWDGANALLTDTEIREELFEKGALPDVTISTGTESAMQTALDVYADTVRSNAPLCIRIESVSGGGDFDLSADNITFSPLASIHIQYTGTDTLTFTNTNGADTSIGSTPNGGSITFINPATLTINGLINGSEVRIYDDETDNGGDMDTELDGIETLSGTSFAFDHSGATNTVVIQMMATGYEEISQRFELDATDQSLTLFPKPETNT